MITSNARLDLDVFQFLILNFLISQIDDDSQSAQTGVAATTKLLVDMVGIQLKEALSPSHRLSSSLRRENVCATLRKEFIAELPVLLAGLPFTSDALFGKAFSKSIKKLTKKVRDKNTLDSELKPLSALRDKAKQGRKATSGRNNPGSAPANKEGGATGS